MRASVPGGGIAGRLAPAPASLPAPFTATAGAFGSAFAHSGQASLSVSYAIPCIGHCTMTGPRPAAYWRLLGFPRCFMRVSSRLGLGELLSITPRRAVARQRDRHRAGEALAP